MVVRHYFTIVASVHTRDAQQWEKTKLTGVTKSFCSTRRIGADIRRRKFDDVIKESGCGFGFISLECM